VPENGFVTLCATKLLEDDIAHADVLLTHPNYQTGYTESFIEGRFPGIVLPRNLMDIQFEAEVGFADSTSAMDATFSVWVERFGFRSLLTSVEKTYDSTLQSLSANLSGYQGETIEILLRVDGAANPGVVEPCWVGARITAAVPIVLFVDDFTGMSDWELLDAAIQNASAKSPAELYFRGRPYVLDQTIFLNGLSDISLCGQSVGSPETELLFDSPTPTASLDGLRAQDCQNIAVRDLSVDYVDVPFPKARSRRSTFRFRVRRAP